VSGIDANILTADSINANLLFGDLLEIDELNILVNRKNQGDKTK
jgi:hypothetical protein